MTEPKLREKHIDYNAEVSLLREQTDAVIPTFALGPAGFESELGLFDLNANRLVPILGPDILRAALELKPGQAIALSLDVTAAPPAKRKYTRRAPKKAETTSEEG